MKHVLKHQKLLLKASNFKRKKFSNGGGMLGKRKEARTGEVMAKKLSLRDSKLIYAQANGQAMGTLQLQDVSEMLKMRG